MRKIEVPTDTQPQFELGDTAEDIERRRREREERDDIERREQEERERQRIERERRAESQERGDKRVPTGRDTDVESIQSRQKKGQMKLIFLSDSDKEAIMEFVKQREELYDSFKDRQKKERLWETLSATRNLPVNTVKKWFETQRTRYGKLTQTKSGQAPEKTTKQKTWLNDSFSVSKSSTFKSPLRPSAATASVLDNSRDTDLRWKSA